jgi:hypothetical protein
MLSGERLLRLMVPPRESAPLSGVWPLMTSRPSNMAPVRLLIRTARLNAPWVEIMPPSIVTVFWPGHAAHGEAIDAVLKVERGR